MTIHPDYADWLTPARLEIEERTWSTPEGGANLRRAANVARQLIDRFGLTTAVEYGCATGHLAALLPPELEYLGVDSNPECIKLATARCAGTHPRFHFGIRDVRKDQGEPIERQLVIAHAFLKHFGAHEWPDVAGIVFRAGTFGVVSMPILWADAGGDLHDDGVDFHHVWVTKSLFDEVLGQAGKKVIGTSADAVVDGAPGRRMLFAFGPR